MASGETGLVGRHEALELEVIEPHTGLETCSADAAHEFVSNGFKNVREHPPLLLHDLFTRQVERTPNAIALRYSDQSLTYAELNARANQLARYLRARGVGPEVLVGIYFEPGPDLVTALLAVLKAGGAYVPLDAAYPAARVAYVLKDCAPRLVLSGQELGAPLQLLGYDVVVMESARSDIRQEVETNISAESVAVTPSNIAYVIYTSGSTGEPKGVSAEHRGMVNRILAQQDIAPFSPDDVCCQKTSIGFVDAVFEILGPLAWGRPLVIAPGEANRDPVHLAMFIEQRGVTRLISVPSLAQALLDSSQAVRALQGLRHWTLSGEALSERLALELLAEFPGCSFANLYGSSEVAADVTAFSLSDFRGGSVPIGRPIANTKVYVLDDDRAPVPIGEKGEIYISGPCVARGYLNRPNLTSERFIPDPFGSGNGACMYRTGDLGLWRADGVLEYLGRRDHQVKVRGYRIELGEIEAHLERHPEVDAAAVVLREDTPGWARLAAYVIPRYPQSAPSIAGLRQYLKTELPDYMVPSVFMIRDSFPLTQSGKLDRKGLPLPDLASCGERPYEPPQGEVEAILAGIWQDLLQIEAIGRNGNFFELGGDSLLAVQLVERLGRRGFSVESRRIFESATLAELASMLRQMEGEELGVPANLIPTECETIVPAMLPLVDLTSEELGRIEQSIPGGAQNIQDIYPLAPVQHGMLFHHLLDQEMGDAYAISTMLRFSSRERMEEIIAALQWSIDRHDILRTAVLWEGLSRPVQVVCRQATLSVEQIALDPSRDPMAQLEDRMRPEQQRLDVRKAPMLRIEIVSDPREGCWYGLVRTHHLVCDGESLETLLAELKMHISGRAEELPEPVPYRDHVFRALNFARTRDSAAFFRSKLGDIDEPTTPFGLRNVRGDGGALAEARIVLEPALGRQLRKEAGRLGLSAAAIFHAAWALVVGRTSARDDVVFGTVLLGRLQSKSGYRRAVGVFINTLPLRLRLNGITTKELVEQANRELIELMQYEQASLVEAQRSSSVAGTAPVFSALLNYRRSADSSGQWAGVAGMDVRAITERTNYPIAVSIDDSGNAFALTAQTLQEVDPRRILDYLETATRSVVEALAGGYQALASALRVLPVAESVRILNEFNGTREYPQEQLLQEAFEGRVRLHPQAIAVSCEGESLTYAELNARANQLAWHLRDRGVGAERLVGICMERGLEMVVGLLGILKAGGAYVPLDPSYPAERLAYMLGDAAPSVVLIQERLKGRLPQSVAEVVTIDADWELIGRRSTRDPALRPQGLSAESLAYVIYTSGSTGKPKGVMVEHRNVGRLFAATENWFGFGERDVWTLFHSFAFDFSVWELWGALLYGGRVVIVPHLTARSPQEFYRLLCREGVTVLNQTPSAFAQLAQVQAECPDLQHALRVVIFGGEALEFRVLRPWVKRNGAEQPRLINMYGITETTVHVTYRQLSEEEVESERGSIIGRPIPDLKTYLLDRHGQPVPIGVAGEIYVGGAGVARGYLNRRELTVERFVPDPFSADRKARMYKTGDLGRWRADGTIEYLGRNDEQVKIRGFRIELGEIEAQLARHGDVKEAVVLAREDEPGEKRLVGYVIAKAGAAAPSAESLREHLKGVLPEYMVPSAFVLLEALPLTPNGKLDRRSLPAPDQSAYTRRQYEAPRGEVEEILAGIWQELLKVERVGRNDNFFELGGHSLLIVQMLERLRRVGLSAEVRRVFESPTLSDLASTLMRGKGEAIEVPPNLIPAGCERITPEMLPLLQLEQEHIDRIVEAVPGGAANIQDIYPLAPLQEGMLFHHLLDQQGADAYVLPILLSLSSRERVHELIEAVQATIDRHDVLRTAILWEQLPRPVQVVCRKAELLVGELSLRPNPDAGKLTRLAQQRLDLRRAPLVRLQVAPDPDGDQWHVLLRFHHVTCDHITTEILTSELVAILKKQALRALDTVPYRNHVAHMLAHAERDSIAFFKRKLGDVTEPTAPFGVLEVHGDGSQVREVVQEMESDLCRRVRLQARRLSVSAATLFHAAWALVVANISGRDDVVFGTMLVGRLQGTLGVRLALGMFINTLPLRLQLGNQSAKELIDLTQRELIELLANEHAPLAMAQRCSAIAGSAPLFTALMNYRHSIRNPDSEWDSAAGVRLLEGSDRTNYPIAMSVDDLGEGFSLTAQADRGIDPWRILDYLSTAMTSLVDALERSPSTSALSLQVLPEAERRQVIECFNATDVPYPKDGLVHVLFEEQVKRAPQAIAVMCEGQSVSYAELNARANQLASYLRDGGVGTEQLVGICMERSIEMVVGLLGILKAGGAYVPLDPSYPAERLTYMLEDARPSVVLIQERLRGRLSSSNVKLIALDGDCSEIGQYASSDLPAEKIGLQSDHLAYVIYTSGSTGRPKGAMNEHGAVVNRILWMQERYHLGHADRVLQKTPFSFDVSVWEFFWPLMIGARLIVARPGGHKDPGYLMDLIEGTGISTLHLVPSMLQAFLAQYETGRCASIRHIVCSGEELTAALKNSCLERLPQARLSNLYGPTECAVDVTSWECTRDEIGDRVPIGRPIANTRIYVLDQREQPVAIGVIGQIHIAGVQVGRGYLNRRELTVERFVPDPFSADRKARMYKTGDLGRWRADGTIEYLGRNDEQVKIRGFRIELGEIEAQLARHGDVKEAVVLAREDEPGEKRLVGYVIAKAGAAAPSAESLREHLKGVLPEYMVPSAFVLLEALPLTPNGKLDRRSLPAPDQSAYTRRQYEAPRGEVEEILAGIWQELLKVERVGRNDNFFELGGHSLLIVQMLERLRRVGLSAEVRRVFESPTLSDLASTLMRGKGEAIEVPPNLIPAGCERITPEMLPLVQLEQEHIDRIVEAVPGGAANIQDIYPLAPLQEGMLFHHLLDRKGEDTYVLANVLSISDSERLAELIAALQTVVNRHDVLRTAILWEDLPRPVQVVHRRLSLPVEEVALPSDPDGKTQVREWLSSERQWLDIRLAPLIRLKIAKDGGTARWYALLQLHHLVCDNGSQDLMLAEVTAYLAGQGERLPMPVPYRHHVAEAIARANSQDSELFFRSKLGDVGQATAPLGLLDVHGDGHRADQAAQPLPAELATRLVVQARRLGVTAATLFHGAWALVVARCSSLQDIVFGTVLLGRLQSTAGAQRTLGMFINTLPLRLSLAGLTARRLVEQTQRELVELLMHEQTSLAVAQKSSGVPASTPLFTALLNYRHGAANLQREFGPEGVSLIDSYARTNYPILLSVDEFKDGFGISADTHRSVSAERVVAYMCTAVESLVEALEQDTRTPAVGLEILPESERRLVLDSFNATEADYPRQRVVHELFEEQVRERPNAVAVEHDGRQLTYAQLNARANQLGRYLVSQGIGADQVVGLCLERGLEMLVGLLGILKAGGAYLPLDPNYPSERLRLMLEDAAPNVILTETELAGVLPACPARVIALDEKLGQLAGYVTEDLPSVQLELSSDNLVYVIYTSGSTGTPKGIAMQHRSAVNLIDWHRRIFGAAEGQRVLQFAALSFDVAFQEVFSTLCTGGTLVLLDEWVRRDARALTELLVNRGIARLFVPPLVLQSLAEYAQISPVIPQSLKDVITAGERLTVSAEIKGFFVRLDGCRLHNHYGPTETHVVTALMLSGDSGGWPTLPSIGFPIFNTRIYVLDKEMQPVPIGVPGEIYIGGANVARGYLNRPELTAERFLPDPFSADPKGRIYRTGDLGRWRADGTIEYLGRNDEQVKIRGFRVELGEIEAQLMRHEDVKEAVVLAREDAPGQKRLVGYVIGKQKAAAPNTEILRKHLMAALPEYMVPSAFVVLEMFPLTPNGKLDRRVLPAPDYRPAYTLRSYEAPRGRVEEIMAGIWREVLKVERVSRNDNFFELGGHSLSATQVVVRIRSLLSIDIPIRMLFKHRILHELSNQLTELCLGEEHRLAASHEEQAERIPEYAHRALPDKDVHALTGKLQQVVAP